MIYVKHRNLLPKSHLSIPNVYAFIERAAGQKSAVRAKGNTVNRFSMSGQCSQTRTTFDIPQSYCCVERCTKKNMNDLLHSDNILLMTIG